MYGLCGCGDHKQGCSVSLKNTKKGRDRIAAVQNEEGEPGKDGSP